MNAAPAIDLNQWGRGISGYGAAKNAKPATVRRPSHRTNPAEALTMTMNLIEDMGRKFELVDVEGDTDLLTAAEAYVRAYAAKRANNTVKAFDFMDSMVDALSRYKSLTWGQAKGVLNCLRAAMAQRAEQQPVAAAPAAPEPVTIPNGTYTVVVQGGHITLRLTTADEDKFGPGKQIAAYLNGQDNDNDYQGFAFVTGTRFNAWKRFAMGYDAQKFALNVLLTGGLNNAKEAGIAYARESGRCCVCNRTLTDPESIENGIGPVCAGKFGG